MTAFKPAPLSTDTETRRADAPSPAEVTPSGYALSRFEFETGKGNEGTKVLMVEWDSSSSPAAGDAADLDRAKTTEDWEVSWEGKTTVLAIRDPDPSAAQDGSANRRVYFLLPPGAPVPPLVTITKKSAAAAEPLRTKPMPAIFHPALLAPETRRAVGPRGVLHTTWAKKRLVELQAEVDREAKSNGESVGLEMALLEKQWIVDHFGLSSSYTPKLQQPPTPTSPSSPRSPVPGRLGDKLKGLKLATSPTELAAAAAASKPATTRQAHISTLSPQAADVAVSSFSAFHGGRTMISARPAGASQGSFGAASLDEIIGGGISGVPPPACNRDSGDTEEDLFVLPMSPRSPEMTRSPFSIL